MLRVEKEPPVHRREAVLHRGGLGREKERVDRETGRWDGGQCGKGKRAGFGQL